MGDRRYVSNGGEFGLSTEWRTVGSVATYRVELEYMGNVSQHRPLRSVGKGRGTKWDRINNETYSSAQVKGKLLKGWNSPSTEPCVEFRADQTGVELACRSSTASLLHGTYSGRGAAFSFPATTSLDTSPEH